MKLMLQSYSPIAMDVTMPERVPLGGSESALAYLARQLAKNGHDVTFAARLPPGMPERVMGVKHVTLEALDDPGFFAAADFEAIIALSAPAVAARSRRLAPKAVQISWLHLLPGQSAMAPLAAMAPHIDRAVFVSQTQARMVGYGGAWSVIGNGIAPAFESMFTSAAELRAAKQNRAVYTSMPYRGLHLLLDVAEKFRSDTDFDIYSAMRTYGVPEDNFTALYARAENTPRTRYHGAVAQPQLAEELRTAAFLAYPCAFIETYCIAALEAMAAGLKVVSTALGALPETTMGFADLLPLNEHTRDEGVVAAYAALLEKNVAAFLGDPEDWAAQRFEQSRTVNRLCSWRARAAEWEKLLGPLIALKRG